MKINSICIVIIFMATLLTGCRNLNIEEQDKLSITKQQNKESQYSIKNNEEQNITVIANIDAWSHPTKKVFEKYSLKLYQVDLLRNDKYPIFYVRSNQWSDIYSYDLLADIAKNNGYWDFKINDGNEFIEVYCDKDKKKVTKTISNKGVVDYTSYDFSNYSGKWYNTEFNSILDDSISIDIDFEDGKNAKIIVTSDSEDTDFAQIEGNIEFDYRGYASFDFNDDLWGNKGTCEIIIEDDIIRAEIKKMQVNKGKRIISGTGVFVREEDYLNLMKCMELLNEQYISMCEDVYINYVGKDKKGNYIIDIRNSDTVLVEQYHFDKDTLEILKNN